MTNDSSVFRFELNETLYFEKGQEVNEMRGVSLEPDISIHSFHDYITIKGIIELKGEYEKSDRFQVKEDIETDDFHAKRYVEAVEEMDNDLAIFSHRFPVEISVPVNRVADLNDVSVYIQSFDYEVPEPSRFRLYSTIEIHGLNKYGQFSQSENNSELDSVLSDMDRETESNTDVEEEQFEFELKRPDEETMEEQPKEAVDLPMFSTDEEQNQETERNNTFNDAIVEETTKEEEAKDIVQEDTKRKENEEKESASKDDKETDETGRWKYKETKSLKEFFANTSKDKAEEVDDEEDEYDEEDLHDEDEEYDDQDIHDEDHDMERKKAEDFSPEIRENSDNQEDNERVRAVSYLSDMFSNSEEESYTKMRLCIVQEQDTIDSIAERYQISALQLIKLNRLDEDYDVKEGQLLFIPHKKK
ncbi:LysM peptidoglycan-binding domain-containing protein [Virgibacillus proomii]|uniref:LysM peptidoglycan-binding domain-containing protein n=1 Tax=Virgibacillus proomii TaxID=84407 RepID=UPI001C10C4B3|nr:LysM peptidoglycan-binding domain-containing protein [Virgibacillus proomii]MBU5265757.1 LysM peptidoglycan-binding domain-containing protein [Virgibacillus proomii]